MLIYKVNGYFLLPLVHSGVISFDSEQAARLPICSTSPLWTGQEILDFKIVSDVMMCVDLLTHFTSSKIYLLQVNNTILRSTVVQ